MSKYDADEWDEVTDYGWQLDMRRVIADIDARLAALESQAKPAPEASGPTSKTNVEPSASLYLYHITYGEHAEIKEVHLATKPEVRAEAVRLGLLDTERQKVAGAFLHAALALTDNHDEDSYVFISGLIECIEAKLYGDFGSEHARQILRRMAAVLKSAAKETTE